MRCAVARSVIVVDISNVAPSARDVSAAIEAGAAADAAAVVAGVAVSHRGSRNERRTKFMCADKLAGRLYTISPWRVQC